MGTLLILNLRKMVCVKCRVQMNKDKANAIGGVQVWIATSMAILFWNESPYLNTDYHGMWSSEWNMVQRQFHGQ